MQGFGRFRPQTFGEILDGVFTLYRRNFLLIVAIAAVVQIPYAVLELLVLRLTGALDAAAEIGRLGGSGGGQITPQQSQALTNDLGVFLAVSAISALVALLIAQPLSQAATTRAVSDRYLDRPASFGESYRHALRRLPALIGYALLLVVGLALMYAAIILLAVAVTPAMLLLLIPAVVFTVIAVVRYSVAPSVIVIERVSAIAGMRRSWALTSGFAWRVFGLWIVIGIISAIVSEILRAIAGLFTGSLSGDASLVVTQVASTIATVLAAPLTLIAFVLIYYDLRIRREAFDVEMLAASL